MSETRERRQILRQLLLEGNGGSTQAQLVEALAEQHGIATTQSTVSRDLKYLGAERRLRDDGTPVYRLDPGPGVFPIGMVVAVEHNEMLIVVRTRVGRAPAVGIEIDALELDEVLGTIAGDDTVLVIPRSMALVDALAAKLRELAEL
jgi:transcriptional regulator of arginine metabolism